MKKECVVLFSGGIDSYIHLCWAERNFDKVTALYVDLEHRYSRREFLACQELLENHPRVEFIGQHFNLKDHELPNGFIPCRNMYLLQLAAYHSSNIVFGTLHHESAPDHRMPFLKTLMRLIQTQYWANEYVRTPTPLTLYTPFVDLTKTALVRWYLQHVNPYDSELRKTVACYQEHAGCGRCRSCLNRWVAFKNNHLPDEAYTDCPYDWAAYKALCYHQQQSKGEGLGILKELQVQWYNLHYKIELRDAFQKHLARHDALNSGTPEIARGVSLGYILSTGAK